jgi:hypothetical protein
MKQIIAIFYLGFLLLGAATLAAEERPTLVELFTSEGCSSCPPAEALLVDLARRPDVLALSFHVDYWDKLGWKDPFSSPAATQRQQHYADLLHLATVYTPQIIVDGKWQGVGSNRAEVRRAMDSAQRTRDHVPITLDARRGRAKIEIGPRGDAVPAALLLIGFDRRHVSAVARGENGGRMLAHVDVVRSIEEVAQYDGRAQSIEALIRAPAERVAAILQARDGRVLGVAVGDADQQTAASGVH